MIVILSFKNRKLKDRWGGILEEMWRDVIESDDELIWHYESPEVENPGRVTRYTKKHECVVWYPKEHDSRWSNMHIYYSTETGGASVHLLKADKKHIKKVVEIAEKLDCDVIRGRKKINDRYK